MKHVVLSVLCVLALAAFTGCDIVGYQKQSHNADSSNHDNPVTTNIYTNDMGTADPADDQVVTEEAPQ